MSSRVKFGLIITVLLAVAIFASFWVTVVLNQPQFGERRSLPPGGFIAGDFEYFYLAYTIISTINIALLLVLVINYVNIYIKTRSQFTVGLIIFASAFLIKDLTASPFISALFSFRAVGLGPFVFLPGIFECAALIVLLYLSIRY
jgi:hypothetical protein